MQKTRLPLAIRPAFAAVLLLCGVAAEAQMSHADILAQQERNAREAGIKRAKAQQATHQPTPSKAKAAHAANAASATPKQAASQPAAPATAQSAQTTGTPVTDNGENVSLNFNSVEIDAVVRAIGKITGKNFIVDPRVKGTLNIVTNSPVPHALTYSILLSALRLQGYTAVETGNVVKILPEADAKMHSVPVDQTGGQKIGGDKLITEVFQIHHESAAQLVQVLRPLVTPNNTVSVYPGNNSLVITDYAENVARISRIIESIDVPQGDAQVIPVRNASALDLATTLNKLFADSAAAGAAGGDSSQRATILADSRSNSLLVRSENRSRLQAIRSMAAQLDQVGASSNIRVIFLKNANAAKVAQTLRSALTGEAGSGNASTNSMSANTPTFTANSSSSTSSTSTTNTTNTSTTGTTGSTGAGSSQANSTPTQVNGGTIFADTANNALVITGPDAVYNSLRGVIDRLDRRPAQVYVEALIAEVTADRAADFGIQWQGATTGSGTNVYGGTNFGSTSSGSNLLTLAAAASSSSTSTTVTPGTGMNFIVGSGKSITIGGLKIADLNLLARFMETDTRTNVLSTPSLITVDNEEAKIVVGKNVPFVTGSYTSTTTSSSNPFQTIERKDVGLTLKIKPQITEGGSIRMQIYQEASAVLDSSSSSTLGPSTSKRSVETTVVADNEAIVVLGGLVEDSYTGSVDKVPLLGDLPVIGHLFRFDSRKRTKTNLMVFLRPRILRSAEDTGDLSQDRYNEIIGLEKKTDKPSAILNHEDPFPTMPSVEKKANKGLDTTTEAPGDKTTVRN